MVKYYFEEWKERLALRLLTWLRWDLTSFLSTPPYSFTISILMRVSTAWNGQMENPATVNKETILLRPSADINFKIPDLHFYRGNRSGIRFQDMPTSTRQRRHYQWKYHHSVIEPKPMWNGYMIYRLHIYTSMIKAPRSMVTPLVVFTRYLTLNHPTPPSLMHVVAGIVRPAGKPATSIGRFSKFRHQSRIQSYNNLLQPPYHITSLR